MDRNKLENLQLLAKTFESLQRSSKTDSDKKLLEKLGFIMEQLVDDIGNTQNRVGYGGKFKIGGYADEPGR